MLILQEGTIERRFDETWTASRYDQWPYYREHFQSACGGNKAVDFIAHDPQGTLWLIEVKDYRVDRRTKPMELSLEIAHKVRDSLAGIVSAAKWHAEHSRQADAIAHIQAEKIRVVLHLEQPKYPSKMFPGVGAVAGLQAKLKQHLRGIDPHPVVVDVASAARLSWAISSSAGQKP